MVHLWSWPRLGEIQFGRLSEAWSGEAADFTPLLADKLNQLGRAIGVDLTSVGRSEVPTTGGRRIDIVAQGEDGSEFVIRTSTAAPTTITLLEVSPTQ